MNIFRIDWLLLYINVYSWEGVLILYFVICLVLVYIVLSSVN